MGTASGRSQQERAGARYRVCQHSAVRVVGTGCCAGEMEIGGALARFLGLVVWGEGEAVRDAQGVIDRCQSKVGSSQHESIILDAMSLDAS